MSLNNNIESYKPGSVRRVKLQNFLTYSEVEFFPGPRLNVVVGPNGTGKSTLLCALCLGLGGQPSLLGRADDARTFIMHQQDVATIEIELVPHTTTTTTTSTSHDFSSFGTPHILRRVIDRNLGSESGKGMGASKFYINNTQTTHKTLKQLVTTLYHIQIDNLCTFLPQDKVGSFSGFNPQRLLLETEKALLLKWYETHQTLMQLEDQVQAGTTEVQTIGEKLADLQRENTKLEQEKERMEERQRLLTTLEKFKQKRIWLRFDEARQRAVELKAQKQALRDDLRKARQELQPLEERHASVKTEADRMTSHSRNLEKRIKQECKTYEKSMQKFDHFQDEMESELRSIHGVEALQRKAERLAQAQEARLAEQTAQLDKYPPKEELLTQRDAAARELRSIRTAMDKSRRVISSLNNQASDCQEKKSALDQKLQRMNDDKARRKENIFRRTPALAKTFAWVDQNRTKFRRPVWGPIVCEVNIQGACTASYLEQHVPNSMLKAYVVECREDYNLLFREVREGLKLPINIHIVPQGKLEPVRRRYSPEKMAMLQRDHGVKGYLDEEFAAPDAVMQALRSSANVQNALVGSVKTQESLDRRGLLDILTQRESSDGNGRPMSCVIFSRAGDRSYKYTSTVSRYSGKSSVRVDEITPARMLAPGVSQAQKDDLKEKIQTLQVQLEQIQPELDAAKQQQQDLTTKGQTTHSKHKEVVDILRDLESQKHKVAATKRKLEDLQRSASKDNVAEKEELMRKLCKHVENCNNALEGAASCHEGWMEASYTLSGAKMTEFALSSSAQKLLDTLTERKQESLDLEKRCTDISAEFTSAKQAMKNLKDQADKQAPLKDANGNDLPLKDELDRLPVTTLEEVDAAIDEAKTTINSISANPEVLRTYERRKKEIEEIRRQMEGLSEAHDAKRAELDATFRPWETALVNTTKEVNRLFQTYMQELGCAGEVSLKAMAIPDQEGSYKYNFRDWGMEIKVKFRESASLQVLSAQVQSGGERSVSTIMYLMALQELMSAPFRCVDEINQGLDERNERLVFRRIVENSTRESADESGANHSGQYFLITPKLLPNLTDMEHEDVTILFIFNGPRCLPHYSDWNTAEFLKCAQKKRRLTDEA